MVGIGGTTRESSTSESALAYALGRAAAAGAHTELIRGTALAALPMYDPSRDASGPEAARMIAAVRAADAVVVSSPGYHGSIAGVVKNALDYIEDLREDERPYLDGRPVGCIATGYGWQAVIMTLQSLRSVVHALRGWPTPLGVGINSSGEVFAPDGSCVDDRVRGQLDVMVEQMMGFAARAAATEVDPAIRRGV